MNKVNQYSFFYSLPLQLLGVQTLSDKSLHHQKSGRQRQRQSVSDLCKCIFPCLNAQI